ncbi:MAG: PHP domain-containing protein [Acholeplasmataceae bacterium]|nr:PHP domain-containing protein [Acholeplasmataceae bacterium]
MIYYYDLHIHTVLSPCADVLMTPNNIFNMAMLKGLDVIAITDHNSAKQLPICEEISKSYDILFIPGIEVSVKEGFHVLVYFKCVADALKFDEILENFLKKQDVDLSIYNEQVITDIHDEKLAIYPYLLLADTCLTFKDLISLLKDFEILIGYAHLDRNKHSGIDFVHHIALDFVELTHHVSEAFIEKHLLDRYTILMSSDAHQITDLLEKQRTNKIELDHLTIDSFFRYFHHG